MPAAMAVLLFEQRSEYFQIATCVRPGEVRFAPWSEIDEDAKLWRIPAERMKMRTPFVQPLSPLALSILKRADELRQTHEPDELIFPGFTRTGHLSENELRELKRMYEPYAEALSSYLLMALPEWLSGEDGRENVVCPVDPADYNLDPLTFLDTA